MLVSLLFLIILFLSVLVRPKITQELNYLSLILFYISQVMWEINNFLALFVSNPSSISNASQYNTKF